MSFLVMIGGAIALLAVLIGLATFAPKALQKAKPGPDAGADAAAGESYGSLGVDMVAGDGDGD